MGVTNFPTMKLAKLEFHKQSFQRLYVTELTDMLQCVHSLFKSPAKYFGLDIETGKQYKFIDFEPVKKGNRIIGPCPGLCPLMSYIRLIQIYDPIKKRCYVFDLYHIGDDWKRSTVFRQFLLDSKFIAHNGVFEIKHFTHNGFPNMTVHCSMLLNILVDRAERSPFEPPEEDDDEPPDGLAKYKKTSYGLDAVIGRLYKIRISKFFQTSNWNAPELSKDQINYAALDAILTYRVGIDMMKKVKRYNMVQAYNVLRKMQHVVADMELTGVAIDKEQHQVLISQWKVEHAKLTAECERRFDKVNLRSSLQLNKWAKAKYKHSFWETHWPQTDSSNADKIVLSFGKDSLKQVIDVIERNTSKHPKALKSLLGYKKLDKLLSTYGETLARIIHPVTGRIHCSFIIGETRTGRLSSREPNLQNLPRDKSVRKLFIAPKTKHLLVADYSQIEMRSCAALSEESVMTKAFIKGIDLHKYILKLCFGWKLSEITKEQRQLGKAINFGYCFGMGAKKFETYALTSYGVKVTPKDAQKTFDTYHATYKTYSNWCDREREKCSRIGYVRTPLGKIRKLLPEEQYTRSVNTQVQGGAAEIIMLALIYFRQKCPPTAKIVSTIHDEIIIESSDQDPNLKRLLEECMIMGFQTVFPDAPTTGLVDAKFGTDWANAKE